MAGRIRRPHPPRVRISRRLCSHHRHHRRSPGAHSGHAAPRQPRRSGSWHRVAFVATVYGVGSANLFFFAGFGEAAHPHAPGQVMREMTLEGVVSILEGMNPRMLETKLWDFLQDESKPAKDDQGRRWTGKAI